MVQVRRPCRWSSVVVMTAAVLLLLGCGSGDSIFKPTMTQKHASGRLDQILLGTIAQLSPRPRLEHSQPYADFTNCLVNSSDSGDTRKQVSRQYIFLGVRAANASIAQQVLRIWKKDGYAITDTHEIGGKLDAVFGVTPDNFLIALDTTGAGDLLIGADSPCLWPNGTPPPGH